MRIPDAEDDLLASLLMQPATGAVAQIFADDPEGVGGIGDAPLGLGREHLERPPFGHGRYDLENSFGSHFVWGGSCRSNRRTEVSNRRFDCDCKLGFGNERFCG